MNHPNQHRSFGLLKKYLFLVLTALGAATTPAWAGGLREVDQTIFGMDCAPCAAGVEDGLNKLPGATSVRVSLNEGKAVIAFSANSSTTLAQIREVVRHNGFTPKEARATVVGRVVREGNKFSIDMGNERLLLETDGKTLEPQLLSEGAANESTLSVRVPENLSNPPTVHFISRTAGVTRDPTVAAAAVEEATKSIYRLCE